MVPKDRDSAYNHVLLMYVRYVQIFRKLEVLSIPRLSAVVKASFGQLDDLRPNAAPSKETHLERCCCLCHGPYSWIEAGLSLLFESIWSKPTRKWSSCNYPIIIITVTFFSTWRWVLKIWWSASLECSKRVELQKSRPVSKCWYVEFRQLQTFSK